MNFEVGDTVKMISDSFRVGDGSNIIDAVNCCGFIIKTISAGEYPEERETYFFIKGEKDIDRFCPQAEHIKYSRAILVERI